MDDNTELIRQELEEMRRHKWIESEKAGRDVGDPALFEWAEKYDGDFVDTFKRTRGDSAFGLRPERSSGRESTGAQGFR